MQIASFSDRNIYPQPRTPIGVLTNARVEQPDENHVQIGSAINKCSMQSITHNIILKMDVGDISDNEQGRSQDRVTRYQTAFSTHEDDIGFCDLVQHSIITTRNDLVKIPYRRVPPHH